MKNLIDIKDLSKSEIYSIFDLADEIKAQKQNKQLEGKIIALLFFENSTRTLVSFEIAAKKLGATVININIAKSSTAKGESLKDTIKTIEAMGVDAFIIRHSVNYVCRDIRKWLNPETVLINAGDGNNQHPTQALLDTYTIKQNFKKLDHLKTTIIGDIKHSRVASSFIDIAKILDFEPVVLFGPKELLPAKTDLPIANNLKHSIKNKDVVVLLRIQKERIDTVESVDFDKYNENFGFKQNHLKSLNKNSVILHPGPFNRNIEIDSNVVDHHPSLVLEQVSSGVLIRQAVLLTTLLS